MKMEILKQNYKLIKNYKNSFDLEKVMEITTEYFLDFDYIVGDLSYGKIRLKGFCTKENKLFNKINDYEKIEKYIEEKCAYDCGYFILEKY